MCSHSDGFGSDGALNRAGGMIKTVLLLLIPAIPIIALGVWFVDYTMPDKSRLLELEAEFSVVETELPE